MLGARFFVRVRAFVALAGALASLGMPAMAQAAKGSHGAHSAKTIGKQQAESIGAPNAGKLRGAALLHGGKAVRLREGARSWGPPSLVRLVRKAAVEVARKHRGSQMLVGDLSGRTGGPLDRHGSHQSGRDADIGFYVANAAGKPAPVKMFVKFDSQGNGRDLPWAHFDTARNWTLVEAFLKASDAEVRYLFIADSLRAQLLAHAAHKHVAKDVIEKAARVMMSPGDAEVHDDHFHVRIACPEAMRGVCVEEAVVHAKEGASGSTSDSGGN